MTTMPGSVKVWGSVTMTQTVSLRKTVSAAAVCVGLVLGITGCAPEPNEAPSKELAADDTQLREDQEFDAEVEKTPTLPASFPTDVVVLPDGSVIDDAGSHSDSEWFVTLSTASLADARSLREEIASASGFESLGEPLTTSDGGEQQAFTAQGYAINTLTLQNSGQALLSIEIERMN